MVSPDKYGLSSALTLAIGHVAVWDIAEALRSGFSSTAPNHYFAVHMSPIRDITVRRFPPLDQQCQEDLDGEPTMVTTAGYDGSHTAFDLRDAASALTVMHERCKPIF